MSLLWQVSASELQQRYRERSLTPLAVAQACIARLDAANSKINAVVARRDAAFLADAEAATQRHARGEPRSPLDGIPLTVKDSLLTVDLPTSYGTPALRDYRSDQDELAVARARAAGALILGKTNVPEFANEGYTGNPVYGVTGNPWAPDRTPGGSSGGAVAAVAAGIAPLAIAQDGGGSIRRPASHTGLVGLKPSLSMWPRVDILPGMLLDFDVIGPVARTVADARLLFTVLRGPDRRDRSSLSAAQAQVQVRAERRAPLRIRYVERFGAAPLDPQIAASVGAAVRTLASLGHPVEVGALPLDLEFLGECWPQIGQVGLARCFDAHPDWEAQASPRYREMAELGRGVPASRLWTIVDHVAQLRRDSVALFEHVDAIVTPATAALPWAAPEAYPRIIDGHEVGPRGHAVYTGWVNAAGLPGLALPTAPSAEGLPIGLQIVGPYGSDDVLLDIGSAYEAAAPWADRWPAL